MIVDFEKFRKTEGASPSRLADFDYSPLLYKTKKDDSKDKEDTVFMRFGSLIDCLLTEPSEFKNKYSVSSVELPSDSIKNIVTRTFEEIKFGKEVSPFLELEDFSNKIKEHANYEQYGQSWKEETVIKKVVEAGSDYFQSLVKSIGKQIVSPEDYDQALACVDTLKTNQFTSQYFSDTLPEGIDRLWQVPVVWESYGVTCKGVIDLIIIDHIKKVIYIIDLKTTGKSVYTFEHSYLKFRYYLQGAMYYQGVLHGINLADFKAEGYKIRLPLFVVLEQKNYNPPFIYPMGREDYEVACEGGYLKSSNKPITGFKKLLSDLAWHQEKDMWDYPKDVYLNKGRILLENFKL